ncbi:uncharacterized protein LOC120009919 [Tripterygium wilfordii]|uniref:uncharacterized protein LOC120009919 n=1 Tax=Tripterygium wilfordii TaxID=458696 RepID=UPI0018F83D78|nr:uncharacterized protein LOC120009919 [Tripterygium wilfordii]
MSLLWQKKIDGIAPSHGQLYINTHRRRDGSFATDNVRKKIGELQDKITQNPESAISREEDIGWRNDDVYTQVFGPNRHGHVKGVRTRPVPSQKSNRVPRQLYGLRMTTDMES